MAKLTATEIKTLANEAFIRVTTQINEENKKILNSKEYKEFPDHFDETPLGKVLHEAGVSCAKAASLLYKEFDKPNNYHDRPWSRYEGLDGNHIQIMEKLRSKMFPLYDVSSIDYAQESRYGYSHAGLYDYFVHKLTLDQLTTNSDVSGSLDVLVQEVVTKILSRK